jgi:hypothetical protein
VLKRYANSIFLRNGKTQNDRVLAESFKQKAPLLKGQLICMGEPRQVYLSKFILFQSKSQESIENAPGPTSASAPPIEPSKMPG